MIYIIETEKTIDKYDVSLDKKELLYLRNEIAKNCGIKKTVFKENNEYGFVKFQEIQEPHIVNLIEEVINEEEDCLRNLMGYLKKLNQNLFRLLLAQKIIVNDLQRNKMNSKIGLEQLNKLQSMLNSLTKCEDATSEIYYIEDIMNCFSMDKKEELRKDMFNRKR